MDADSLERRSPVWRIRTNEKNHFLLIKLLPGVLLAVHTRGYGGIGRHARFKVLSPQ